MVVCGGQFGWCVGGAPHLQEDRPRSHDTIKCQLGAGEDVYAAGVVEALMKHRAATTPGLDPPAPVSVGVRE